jgi:uncharacterized membrane protein
MNELPADALEKKIRIGCGALAGLAVGASVGIVALGLRAGALWAFVGLAVMVFAFLALRWGDRFWLHLIGVIRWW